MISPDAVTHDAVSLAFGPGATVTAVEAMVGDASTRLYQRVRVTGAPVATAVAMRFAPESVGRSDEATAGPVPTELPFLNVQRTARAQGVRVPAVYADLSLRGCVLLEDLGDDTLFQVLQRTPRTDWLPWYTRAVDLLAVWQRAFAVPVPGSVAFTRHFDRSLLRWELDHFREWALDVWRAPRPRWTTALGHDGVSRSLYHRGCDPPWTRSSTILQKPSRAFRPRWCTGTGRARTSW